MPQPCVTRAQLTAAIAAFYARHRRWPVALDFRHSQGLPSCAAVLRRFPTLDAARQAAGMPPDALPRRGTAFDAAWATTWPRDAEVTAGGEEP